MTADQAITPFAVGKCSSRLESSLGSSPLVLNGLKIFFDLTGFFLFSTHTGASCQCSLNRSSTLNHLADGKTAVIFPSC